MNKFKKLALPFALLFLVLLSTGLSVWDGEASGQKPIADNAREEFPIVDSTAPEPADPAVRAKRLAKRRKFNQTEKLVGPTIVQSSESYNWPADFPALPTALSDAVILGEICGSEAYLSEDNNSVFSEFTVRLDEVFKNATPSLLAQGSKLVMERKGGRVRYPSGQVSWLSVVGQGMPRVGRRYVLFLRQVDQDFHILTAYEIQGSLVVPIDYSPGVVNFDRYKGSDVTVFLDEVRIAIAKS